MLAVAAGGYQARFHLGAHGLLGAEPADPLSPPLDRRAARALTAR